MATNDVYLGNPNLKKAGTEIQFTKKQIQEWVKCKNCSHEWEKQLEGMILLVVVYKK